MLTKVIKSCQKCQKYVKQAARVCQKLSFVVARGEILRKQVVFVENAAASVAEIGKLWRRRYVVVEEVQRAGVKGTTSQKVQFARYADNCC